MTECEGEECQYFEGIAGDDLSIPIQLIDESGNPEKLGADDGVTEVVGEFTDGNGAAVQIKLTEEKVVLVDATCGRIKLEISAAVSAALKSNRVKKQTFTIYRLKAGKKKTWVFEGALFLKPRPVPSS